MRRLPPIAKLVRPLVDMYLDSAVAITGCHAEGIERPSCELDVLVIGDETRPPVSLKMKGGYLDVMFIDEKTALKPARPEHAASLAHARPVRDTSLLISTSTAAASAVFTDSCRKSSSGRLASALKALGRVDEALSRGSRTEADLWLLAGSYDFAFAWLYSKERVPAPSHLLRQLRDQSKGTSRGFEAFSMGAALEKSSRGSCAARLEGLSVLHDVVKGRQVPAEPGDAGWQSARLETVRAKAQELGLRVEHAESYSYLGQETVLAVLAVAQAGESAGKGREGYPDIGPLFAGSQQLLGDRLLKELGLGRDEQTLRGSMAVVKEQVSALARRI